MITVRLAIDPGDVHVGWCYGRPGREPTCGEWTPKETLEEVRTTLAAWQRGGEAGELVIEEFVLYPGKAKHQAGSDFRTSQLIGALKLVADDHGVPVVMQSATIKKPTRRQMKARGIESKAVGEGIHASDAELHYYYRTLRDKGRAS